MVWVEIDDSGAGMKDFNGTPITPGGFRGEMSKYETTNAQYCQYLNAALASNDIFVDSGGDVIGNSGPYSGLSYFSTYPSASWSQITYSGGTFSVRSRDGSSMSVHPVVMVSWYGATAFCNYYGYRLPTEWEWQQAATGGNPEDTYPWGLEWDPSKANTYESGLGRTTAGRVDEGDCSPPPPTDPDMHD
jgi:formylglycine-generating enzyme required for sulfatase activity